MPESNTKNDPFALPPVPPRRAQGLDQGVAAILYVFGSTAVRDFAQPLGVTCYKTGLSSRRDIQDRRLDVSRTRYASIVADKARPDRAISIHCKGHEWFLSPLQNPDNDPEIAAGLAKLPAGAIEDGVVKFRLPHGVDLATLEQRYQLLLAPRNLMTFLDSLDGRERLEQVGLPSGARLFSDYCLMLPPRRSMATELFCIRPRKEIAILIAALNEALRLEIARLQRIAA
jgi:hypothetical protein